MKLNIDFDISDLLIIDFIRDFDGYYIKLDYYWDNSLEIEHLKKNGYSIEEILEELEKEYEEFDLEYSFSGTNKEFLEFQKSYDCWDDLTLYDIKVLTVDVVRKTLYIKYIAVNCNF